MSQRSPKNKVVKRADMARMLANKPKRGKDVVSGQGSPKQGINEEIG